MAACSTGLVAVWIAGDLVNKRQSRASVGRIKHHTKLPVCVGFGIRSAQAARAIAGSADGAVVGSALVDALRNSLDAGGRASARTVDAVAGLAASLAQGVREAKLPAE